MKLSKHWITFILFSLLFLSGLFLMEFLQSSLQGTTMILGIDLYPRWIGAQVVLQGENPYTLETRQQIWQALYGITNTPNGNPFGFYYPPAIITLLMPFVMLGLSVENAALLWCAFLWAILPVFLILWSDDLPNVPKKTGILPILFISGWLFRPAFSNYLLGQFALFSILATIAAWISYKNNKLILAGIFTTLSLIKPSLTIIPVGLLLILNRNKIKGIVAFFSSSLFLYLPPTFLLGWWLPDFLADISKYASENEVGWSISDIWTITGVIWLLLSAFLLFLGLYKKNNILTLGAAFALNAIFVPHTADYDLVAFIMLLVYLGNSWLFREKKKWLFKVLYFSLVWFPWVSLLAISKSGVGNAVEVWYRFIWLTYPNIILVSSILTDFSSTKLAVQTLLRNKNVR